MNEDYKGNTNDNYGGTEPQKKESLFSDSMISEPDENGVRYYNTGQHGGGAGGPGGPAGPGGPMGPGGRKKSMKKPLLIFACVILAVLLLAVACGGFSSDSTDEYGDSSEDHISILHIEGTIGSDDTESLTSTSQYDHQWTLDQLDEAIDNPYCKGLILFLDTPGGGVYETDEIYLKLQEYKKSGRPVYSAMGSMAASGGYYISAPADKIIANRNCWTGSIGVTIGTLYDVSDLLDKYGVKTVTITSGKNKAMGSSVDPLTKEQKTIFQSLVDESYEQFVGIVAAGRNMPKAKVKKIADGRIYTAKQALANGLIDQIGTLDEAVADMQKTYHLEDCETYDMEYSDDSFFGTLFGQLAGVTRSSTKSDVAALLEIMNDQGETPIMYMSEVRK